jgi:hypothetical protein
MNAITSFNDLPSDIYCLISYSLIVPGSAKQIRRFILSSARTWRLRGKISRLIIRQYYTTMRRRSTSHDYWAELRKIIRKEKWIWLNRFPISSEDDASIHDRITSYNWTNRHVRWGGCADLCSIANSRLTWYWLAGYDIMFKSYRDSFAGMNKSAALREIVSMFSVNAINSAVKHLDYEYVKRIMYKMRLSDIIKFFLINSNRYSSRVLKLLIDCTISVYGDYCNTKCRECGESSCCRGSTPIDKSRPSLIDRECALMAEYMQKSAPIAVTGSSIPSIQQPQAPPPLLSLSPTPNSFIGALNPHPLNTNFDRYIIYPRCLNCDIVLTPSYGAVHEFVKRRHAVFMNVPRTTCLGLRKYILFAIATSLISDPIRFYIRYNHNTVEDPHPLMVIAKALRSSERLNVDVAAWKKYMKYIRENLPFYYTSFCRVRELIPEDSEDHHDIATYATNLMEIIWPSHVDLSHASPYSVSHLLSEAESHKK